MSSENPLILYDAAQEMLEGVGALILLVEDDPANMLLTRTVLEEAGHRILAATTLYDARDVRENPHLQDVPVVALTAHAMPGMADEVFDAGCADYITKPVDITQLVRRVNANLAMGRAHGGSPRHRSPGGRTA